MDGLNVIAGLQFSQGSGSIKPKIKVEDSEKKTETSDKGSSQVLKTDGESKKALQTYSILSNLNVASSTITREQAEDALSKVKDSLSQSSLRQLYGNVDRSGVKVALQG